MYCITIHNSHYEKINKLSYIPVGLGENIFSVKFENDKNGLNISHKNPFYGEYSFHYKIWKNEIRTLNDEKWIGFCQYRKYWSNNKQQKDYKSLNDLNYAVIKKIPKEYDKFDVILGEPLFINQFKLTKFLKKNLFKIICSPSLLYDKNKRTLKFHFDLMHGEGNLDKAISLLDSDNRKDFNEFVNTEVSFNPHNMFICKSNVILNNYYNVVFPWLEKCEEKFGFNLEGYGMKRIYGFLAERFMSFWFKKYTKHTTLPIIFKDISECD